MRPRVVVIGAGFGGLAAVKGLRDAPVDITLVDANNFHTFQPLLYQVASAGLDVDDVAYPVRGIFRRQRNVTVRMARVTGFDLDGRRVIVDRGDPLPYDHLVIAAGAVSADYGVPGVREHTFALKSVDDAVGLRRSILDRLERVAAGPQRPGPGELAVVICGGGPTGVELAGALQELFDKVIARDFPLTEVAELDVTLVEAADRLLGTFSHLSSERALRTLTRRGVHVILGTGVERVTAEGVELSNGRFLPARTVVWTAGVTASPTAADTGLQRGRGGRLLVEADLSIPGRPEVFAVGDIAASPAGDGELLPQVAQPAIQGGRHAARQIVRRLSGQPGVPFQYHDKGSMATIGRHEAVTELPIGIRLWGFVGWLSWLGLHLLQLMGFRNRANVLVNWAWNYLTYDRGARILAEADREAP
jgi:NADH:quinone reductase (non-electrogenic)